MKKKALAMVLAGTMSASLFAGCGNAASAPAESGSTAAAAASTEAAAADTAATEASTEAAAPAEDDWASQISFTASGSNGCTGMGSDYDPLIDQIPQGSGSGGS